MRRILLFVVPALSSALLSRKPEQFPPQCGHDLVLVLVASRKRLVAFVQSLLRLPGHLLDLIAERQILLPPQKEACHVRTVLIRPRRFHQHSSEVTVPGFSDASTPHAIPAGVFARDQTAVTHQLPWALETGHRAKFGNDGGRRRLRHSPQCL